MNIQIEQTEPRPLDGDHVPANRVRLRGRVTTAPQERDLPSGTKIVTVRVSVARDERTAMVRGSRQSVDWVDASAWSARARKSVLRWENGDVVELEGALRRRFVASAGPGAARLEVEILTARLLQRATKAAKPGD